jgi:hypothetical protein
MTGLTRKQVRRLREKIELGDQSVIVKATPLSEILHRWHAEPEFLDENGRPATLPFNGSTGSFSNLVRRFGGDIPPGAMRTELKRVGAIDERDDGALRVMKRTVYPKGAHEKLITALVHALYPLASTIAHNVDPQRKGEPWAQIDTFSQSIRMSDLPRLRRINFDRLSEVAESIDDLFMAYETLHDGDKDTADQTTVAVGVFYFEETDKSAQVEW